MLKNRLPTQLTRNNLPPPKLSLPAPRTTHMPTLGSNSLLNPLQTKRTVDGVTVVVVVVIVVVGGGGGGGVIKVVGVGEEGGFGVE